MIGLSSSTTALNLALLHSHGINRSALMTGDPDILNSSLYLRGRSSPVPTVTHAELKPGAVGEGGILEPHATVAAHRQFSPEDKACGGVDSSLTRLATSQA